MKRTQDTTFILDALVRFTVRPSGDSESDEKTAIALTRNTQALPVLVKPKTVTPSYGLSEQVLNQIVEMIIPKARKFVRFCKNDFDDVVNESLAYIAAKFDSSRGELGAFVHRVVRNVAWTHARKNRRTMCLGDEFFDGVRESEERENDIFTQEEVAQIMALAASEGKENLIYEHFYQGKSWVELENEAGVGRTQYSMWFHRFKQRTATILGGDLDS